MDVIIIILLLISTLLSFVAFCIALSNFLKTGKNRVRFYVTRDKCGPLWLYIGKPVRGEGILALMNTVIWYPIVLHLIV